MKTRMRGLLAAGVVAMTAAATVGLAGVAQATGNPHHGDGHDAIVVCHAVPAAKDQPTTSYQRIVVDDDSTNLQGHRHHAKDVIGPEGDADFQCPVITPSPTPSTTSASPSPSTTSPSPSDTSASPSETSASPSETSASPSETSASPSDTSASPSDTSASPSDTSASPSDTSASPSESSQSPSPSDSTPAPTPTTTTPTPDPTTSSPAPSPSATATTVAPGFLPPTCKYQGTVTIPPVAGVAYSLNGTPINSGVHFVGPGTYTVTARAVEGYVLADGSVTSWTRTFDAPVCATSASPTPSFSEVGGGDPLPQTGGPSSALLGLAGALLAVGLALIVAARRKGTHA